MIGKLLINLGVWFNKHFPEKISTDEVYEKITAIELRLHSVTVLQAQLEENVRQHNVLATAHAELARKVETLTSENTALKTQAALRTRIASSIPIPGR